jgi:NADPH-dependent ferric siderophore reductase
MSTMPTTPVQRVLDRLFLHGTVDAIEDVTPRMRRIRITGESLRDLTWTPGQHIRLRVGFRDSPQTWIRGFRDALRTYSVWDYDHRGCLDLCVLDHPEPGPGVRWSRSAHIGQRVAFTRPEGRLVLQDRARYHLFVGDETASVAFGAMLRALPAAARVHAALAVDAPADRLPLARPNDITWTYRDNASTTDSALLDTLRSFELPTEPGMAYIAGEARTCQSARRHLTHERNWPRKAITVKPFWTPGKRGLD